MEDGYSWFGGDYGDYGDYGNYGNYDYTAPDYGFTSGGDFSLSNPVGDFSLSNTDYSSPGWWETPYGDGTEWWQAPYGGYDTSLGNSPTDYESASGGSSASKLLNDALKALGIGGDSSNSGSSVLNDLMSGLMGGYELYNKYDTDKDLQELLSNQLYNTRNDQYRAYTGQAGEHTRDAYTADMNKYKGDLMMSLMANDKHLPEADREMLAGGLSQLTDKYGSAFDGYANDMVYDRNAKYAADYNSYAPFPGSGTPTVGAVNSTPTTPITAPAAVDPYAEYLSGIPEGTDQAMIDAYTSYLKGA